MDSMKGFSCFNSKLYTIRRIIPHQLPLRLRKMKTIDSLLILELLSINRFTSRSIPIREITSLTHEALYNPMKF